MTSFLIAAFFSGPLILHFPRASNLVMATPAPAAVIELKGTEESPIASCLSIPPCEPPVIATATSTPIPSPKCEAFHFKPLERIVFDFNVDKLDNKAKRQLDTIATQIVADKTMSRLLIRGHTDYIGGNKYNDGLSDRRATTVRDYLLRKGMASERIEFMGKGKHDPNDENWTREGRHRNRRVELFAVHLPAQTGSTPSICQP